MAQESSSKNILFPAPIGGWNPTASLFSMSEFEATLLENFIPRAKYIELRKGYSLHSKDNSTAAIETVTQYSGSLGNKVLVTCAGGKIYNATAGAGVSATSLGTGFTEDRWSTIMFKDKLIFVNGTDQPQQYDPTGGLAAANYTGITDDAVLQYVSVYNQRLYFVEKNSTSIWYPSAGSITGAVTELDIGDQLRKGGNVLYAGTWSGDTGSGITDLFVIVTSEGEILLYGGSYPGGADWSKVGRFTIGKVLGNRAVKNVGSDLIFITEFGVERLTELLQRGNDTTVNLGGVSSKINEELAKAAFSYGTNHGWEIGYSHKEQLLLINVPTATNSSSYQYVVNMLTGSWAKITGWTATSLGEYGGDIYFGSLAGNLFKAFDSKSDNGDYIHAAIRTAFSALGQSSKKKMCHLVKPIVMSDAAINFEVSIHTDYQDDDGAVSSITVSGDAGSAWETATWNTSFWANANPRVVKQYYKTNGLGHVLAVKAKGQFKNVSFHISAFALVYQEGGSL
jgi:hypothetical protein